MAIERSWRGADGVGAFAADRRVGPLYGDRSRSMIRAEEANRKALLRRVESSLVES
jgi:hypothetical protein